MSVMKDAPSLLHTVESDQILGQLAALVFRYCALIVSSQPNFALLLITELELMSGCVKEDNLNMTVRSSLAHYRPTSSFNDQSDGYHLQLG